MMSEFLTLLCNLYIVGLTVVPPLFTGGSWEQLGDRKYALFWNISLFCLAIRLLALLPEVKGMLSVKRKGIGGIRPGIMDVVMLMYGTSVLLSAGLSQWQHTAWYGYREWYMGAFSQLLFVGIYFFVSRHYGGDKYVVRLAEAGFFVVLLFGLLQRLGADPLGLTKGMDIRHWDYSHMLSTIGNISWFTGYCAMALIFPLSGYLRCRDAKERRWLYPVCLCGLMLLLTQGSDTGVLLGAVSFGVCLVWGLRQEKIPGRLFGLWAGVCLLIPLYGNLAKSLGERAVFSFPLDGIGLKHLGWWGWWIAAACFLFLWALFTYAEKRNHKGLLRLLPILTLTSFCMAIAAVGVYFLLNQPDGALWGNGRGMLWKISVEGFLKKDFWEKMIGAGPDCFAEYIYGVFPPEAFPALEGKWQDAVFANAHNEWLNQLINVGIMGTGSYLAIFLVGLGRYRNFLPGVLALILYLTASLTGFQQVLSTPFLFLILGVCEARRRRKQQEDFYGNI